MLAGTSHFSFTVADTDASCAWYERILGLRVVHRQRQDNDYTREFVGVPDAVLEIAELELPGTSAGGHPILLELVEYVQPKGAAVAPAVNDVGGAHLSLVVDDLEMEYERLRAAGVQFRSPPVRITEGVNEGGHICYLSDPDGITVELFQPRPSGSQER